MCRCNMLLDWIGNFMYVLEKLSACFAFTTVLLCLVATLVIVWSFGVGLGYNHCYIEFKTSSHSYLYGYLAWNKTSTTPKSRLLREMDNYDTIEPMRLGESLLLKKLEDNSTDEALIIRPTISEEANVAMDSSESYPLNVSFDALYSHATESSEATYSDSGVAATSEVIYFNSRATENSEAIYTDSVATESSEPVYFDSRATENIEAIYLDSRATVSVTPNYVS